jgi:predicted phage terminase large subunit-like protein
MQRELLHEEYKTFKPFLREIQGQLARGQLAPAASSCQYLQNPLPPEGTLFKREWLKFYEELPRRDSADPANWRYKPPYIVQSWDTASKTKELSNYSVCTTWFVYVKKYYLMDVFRARLEFPQLLQKVIELGHRTYTHKGLPVRRVIVEDAGSGAALIQTLRQGPHKIPVISFTPQGEKAMRLNGHLNLFESGRVLFPQSAPWLEEYISEQFSRGPVRRSGRFYKPVFGELEYSRCNSASDQRRVLTCLRHEILPATVWPLTA